MGLINTKSLGLTIDKINEAFFFKQNLTKSEKKETALWIANRQGLPGSYADMFAPTEKDFKDGFRFFTGEDIKTRAGTSHILGEETCRAIILLDVPLASIQKSMEKAKDGMLVRLKENNQLGMYCCGKCSVSYWRHLAVGGLDNNEERLIAGMKSLKLHRDGNGRWKRFPFYYTLLALTEIDLPSAIEEMKYTAKTCERALKGYGGNSKYDKRRRIILETILAKC